MNPFNFLQHINELSSSNILILDRRNKGLERLKVNQVPNG